MEQANVESRCRLCFSVEDLTCSLFLAEGEPSRDLIEMILECTSIRITLEEDYPSKVCEKCLETLDKFYHYRQRCLQNDKILKSQRNSSSSNRGKLIQVKQEREDEQEGPASPTCQSPVPPEQQAQPVKQEDPGGSSILRSILLQSREPGRAESTASTEQEFEQDNLVQPQKSEQTLENQPEAPPASLLQQMLLQQGFSPRDIQSPASASAVAHPGSSSNSDATSSLLKRMLLEGGGGNPDCPSPLEGPSTMNHKQEESSPPPSNHLQPQQQQQQQHDENHNEEHSETPLASQLRAILMQHRAAAAAAAVAAVSVPPPVGSGSGSTATANTAAVGTAAASEKPEVSYLRSLFLRNDSDANEDSDSDTDRDRPTREMLFNMFQELRARNEPHSDDSDDSEDRAFDYRIPSVRRRSSESTTESRKRRRVDFTCLLCGRPFLNRSKLVLHMRTHIAPPEPAPPPSTQHNSTTSVATASSEGGGGGGTAATAAAVAVAAAAAAAAVASAAPGANAEDDEESRQIELLERRSYACYICGADQNNLQQLKEHLLLAHQDRIRSRGRAKERPKPLINCNFCNRQFRSQFAYGEHLRTHTGERPFPCDQCDKRFPRRFQLLGHLYNVHKQSWVADESKAKFVKK
ncbi:protein sister of odd and bowel-like [Wyeomyia smithii]|uniref:protein sister of odd and bowel-like n=1 Tax=Wyeomyia smithii TaxID=174621 RepID=UPI0024680645|nr:protein sister of odd and bowel-like [Wyeomyia smithii]